MVERPDPGTVLSQLKDFQRETVDYVFRRFYEDPDPTHRFLVADEVGLGKTLVARGVVARTLDHLWDRVGRIDVVYVCSNLDIARQNVNRLNVIGRSDFAIASRITLLPKLVHQIAERKYNFVSFTPDTSFNLKSSGGTMEERMLLYCLLERAWDVRGAGAKNVMQGWVSDSDRFRRRLAEYREQTRIDDSLAAQFERSLEEKIDRARERKEEDLRSRFDELCSDFGRTRQLSNIPAEERRRQFAFIGEMRAVLARTCIRALEPDLVILDEFQRFRNLLGGDDDASLLARELFDFESDDGRARVLLLSATPYKMYTVQDGNSDEDHYADFLQTLRFLQNDPRATERVRALLDEYRRLLFRWSDETQPRLVELKEQIEGELRRVMARTERLAVSEDRNGMLAEVPPTGMTLDVPAVRAYRSLQRVARRLEQPDATEYWKAAPYVLNFMRDYALKKRLTREIEEGGEHEELAQLLDGGSELLIGSRELRGAKGIQPPHARMRWLLEQTVGRDLWKLLWLPPSLPYYQLGTPFVEAAAHGATKRLIFSAWRVVPRAVAALVSHDVERRMLAEVLEGRTSLEKARDSVQQLLRFTRSGEGRLTGMPVLGMLYPSFVLAEVGDPLGAISGAPGAALASLEEVLANVRERIAPLIEPIVAECARKTGAPDESWYWAAPILLDKGRDATATLGWLERDDAALSWIGAANAKEGDENRLWTEHVAEAVAQVAKGKKLGPVPADLAEMLSLQAVAAPGVVALRALGRVGGGVGAYRDTEVRDAAGSVAWAIRNLFNLPDVTALVRMLQPGEPYWERVLRYSAAGGIQAVLDEYAHVLPESLGLIGAPPSQVAREVASEMTKALGLRTAPVIMDEIRVNGDRRVTMDERRLRARFAVRFGDFETDQGEERTRAGDVRSAFNSPFWPFVLATTAVGQEGLDFHQYCHAVVHWNLPSNPVDLEQREGRVHRYKNHAVRKNLARVHGAGVLSSTGGFGVGDPWAAMFAAALEVRGSSASDLVPFWVFPAEGGASVERHVPALPLSRDMERLAALRRTLAVYRMVFGQPRQDELLDYLLRVMSREEAVKCLEVLRIELAPGAGVSAAGVEWTREQGA
jgi:hypothetical protein